MTDVFDQLLPVKWRTVDFALSSCELTFEQDLVEHKYVGVDGSNVEATGRGAMRITCKIPFLNNIASGKGEKWVSGDQYPNNFRFFFLAFANRDIGTFSHPELGDIRCKPQSFSFEIDPQCRDGVIVTASFLETIQDITSDENIDNNLPQAAATAAALDLDASATDLGPLVADYLPPKFDESFDSFCNKLTGAIDKVTTFRTLALNKPAQMLNRIKQVEGAVNRAKTPLTWPITDACSRMRLAMVDIAKPPTASPSGRKVGRYTVLSRTTLAGVSRATGANTDDLIKLNPQLCANPEVPSGTVVRYYL